MCETIVHEKEDVGERERSAPEVLLGAELFRGLGVCINPVLLKLFICERWGRLAALAHAIHDSGTEGRAWTYVDLVADPKEGESHVG